jgi:hypothetical protein
MTLFAAATGRAATSSEDCDDQDRVAFSRILTAPPILVTCAAVSICPRFSSV